MFILAAFQWNCNFTTTKRGFSSCWSRELRQRERKKIPLRDPSSSSSLLGGNSDVEIPLWPCRTRIYSSPQPHQPCWFCFFILVFPPSLQRFEYHQEEFLHFSAVKALTNPQTQGNSALGLEIQTDTPTLLLLPFCALKPDLSLH